MVDSSYVAKPVALASVRKVGWIRWAVVIEGVILRKDWSKGAADFAAKFINDAVSEEVEYQGWLRDMKDSIEATRSMLVNRS